MLRITQLTARNTQQNAINNVYVQNNVYFNTIHKTQLC